MKKIFYTLIFLFCLFSPAFADFSLGNNFIIETNFNNTTSFARANNMDAADDALGVSFIATTTSPIVGIDLLIDLTGDITGINYKYRIETDSSGLPSGSVLGAATSSFAGQAADGWSGLKRLEQILGI